MLQFSKEMGTGRPCLSVLGMCQMAQTHLIQKSIKNQLLLKPYWSTLNKELGFELDFSMSWL